MTRAIELRSDTFTRPTPAMRRAMYEAEVGDDVWNEDPTVRRLEERAASLLSKEAAVFLASGTQGNLIGILSHTRPGEEVIVGDQSHIFNSEAGGAAVVGGLQLHTVPNRARGLIVPADVQEAVRPDDPHFPRTGCLALENSHNRCGGGVMDIAETTAAVAVARSAAIPVHLDGARLFNAAVALGVPVSQMVEPVDSVTFCLSKGLGAPIGSLVCGPAPYIERARKWRKLLGGGMRQVGVIAAAGLVALDAGVDRLHEDHANARLLAEGLANIPGIEVAPSEVQTNIVYFDLSGLRLSVERFVSQLRERGVRVAAVGPATIRAVTSYEVDRADIDRACREIGSLVQQTVPALA